MPPSIAPTDPFLFWRHPPGWRWISFAAAAERVEEGARRLAAVPPGSRVAVPYRPHPQTLLADLAVQRAGLVAVPLGPGDLENPGAAARRHRCSFWLGGEWTGAAVPEGLASLGLEADGGASPPAPPPAKLTAPSAGRSGGAVAIDSAGGEWIGSTRAIDRLARRLPLAGGSQREVLVHWRPLAELSERLLTACARLAGAALALEPEPERLAETVFWCRPTALQGTAAELDALGRRLLPAADRRALRAFRRRFRRLRTLLLVGEAPLSDRSPWRQLGVEIASVAGIIDAGSGRVRSG